MLKEWDQAGQEFLKVIDLATPVGRRLASRLCTWIAFIDQVNDANRDLLLRIAPFADESHNAFVILENIARISKTQPEQAFLIWQRVLEGSHPDFPEDALEKALHNIADQGPDGRRNAKKIVDEYIRAGNDKPAQLLDTILVKMGPAPSTGG